MQAIITKIIPATGHRPTRVGAKCKRGSIIIHYDDRYSTVTNHRDAAFALKEKFVNEDIKRGQPRETNPWDKTIESEVTKGGYVHAFI